MSSWQRDTSSAIVARKDAKITERNKKTNRRIRTVRHLGGVRPLTNRRITLIVSPMFPMRRRVIRTSVPANVLNDQIDLRLVGPPVRSDVRPPSRATLMPWAAPSQKGYIRLALTS